MSNDIDTHLELWIKEREPLIAAGNLEAAYENSTFYHTQAMTELSWELFDKSEELLKIAATGGHPEAVERLNNWPTLKRAFKNRVQLR